MADETRTASSSGGPIAVCFAQFGPYHHARVRALQEVSTRLIIPVEIAHRTETYLWNSDTVDHCHGLYTLCTGTVEEISAFKVFVRARRAFRRHGIRTALLPSYWPASSLALLVAAKSLGIRTVMMSDSHRRTERATGLRKLAKRIIVRQYDAALVAGSPHRSHFANLGVPLHLIFTGYDAVDNTFFAERSSSINSGRSNDARKVLRNSYRLPPRYFLSLGRLVEKKNLSSLITAYRMYVETCVESGKPPFSLVIVGSGPQQQQLHAQAMRMGLSVFDFTELAPMGSEHTLAQEGSDRSRFGTSGIAGNQNRQSDEAPLDGCVYFYGFRHSDENVLFYSLADAFVLASSSEEWGLVVNEAMACSLPVIVSREAGCAEDLVPGPGTADYWSDSSIQIRSNGVLFDPASKRSLASALTFMFNAGTSDAGAPCGRHASGLTEMGERSQSIVLAFGCDNFARQAMSAVHAAEGRADTTASSMWRNRPSQTGSSADNGSAVSSKISPGAT